MVHLMWSCHWLTALPETSVALRLGPCVAHTAMHVHLLYKTSDKH